MAEAGADAFTIMEILGHASIQTSMIYVHATADGLRRALEALGERNAPRHQRVTSIRRA